MGVAVIPLARTGARGAPPKGQDRTGPSHHDSAHLRPGHLDRFLDEFREPIEFPSDGVVRSEPAARRFLQMRFRHRADGTGWIACARRGPTVGRGVRMLRSSCFRQWGRFRASIYASYNRHDMALDVLRVSETRSLHDGRQQCYGHES